MSIQTLNVRNQFRSKVKEIIPGMWPPRSMLKPRAASLPRSSPPARLTSLNGPWEARRCAGQIHRGPHRQTVLIFPGAFLLLLAGDCIPPADLLKLYGADPANRH
jgi:hypothetical protein